MTFLGVIAHPMLRRADKGWGDGEGGILPPRSPPTTPPAPPLRSAAPAPERPRASLPQAHPAPRSAGRAADGGAWRAEGAGAGRSPGQHLSPQRGTERKAATPAAERRRQAGKREQHSLLRQGGRSELLRGAASQHAGGELLAGFEPRTVLACGLVTGLLVVVILAVQAARAEAAGRAF